MSSNVINRSYIISPRLSKGHKLFISHTHYWFSLLTNNLADWILSSIADKLCSILKLKRPTRGHYCTHFVSSVIYSRIELFISITMTKSSSCFVTANRLDITNRFIKEHSFNYWILVKYIFS